MQNPHMGAAFNLKQRAQNGNILATASGHDAIQEAVRLLEETGRELQRDSLQAEIEAFDPIAAQLDDERESAYGIDR